jgi:hypothetical protein
VPKSSSRRFSASLHSSPKVRRAGLCRVVPVYDSEGLRARSRAEKERVQDLRKTLLPNALAIKERVALAAREREALRSQHESTMTSLK